MMPAMAEGQGSKDRLAALRAAIDGIDRELVALLERRAEAVIEIGALKRASGGPIYAPDREAKVLQRALEQASALGGRVPARTLEAVFREIMSGSFALERPLRIGYLGPAGTFSHQAAVAQFGRSVELVDLRAIESVFAEVRAGRIDYGLVPIENSTGGSVRESLDAFAVHGAELHVYAEAVMRIRHALLGACAVAEVRRIHSKAEAFAQCRRFLADQFPHVELVPAASTSAAAQRVAEAEAAGRRGDVAIASTLAGQLHALPAMFESIEDDPNNLTRFFVLAREAARQTGDDKTSIMFTVGDAAGALVEVLACFGAAGVNLSHIDKRPREAERWTYTFFVDALAHREDPKLDQALREARDHCRELTILGSYPRATRVL